MEFQKTRNPIMLRSSAALLSMQLLDTLYLNMTSPWTQKDLSMKRSLRRLEGFSH